MSTILHEYNRVLVNLIGTVKMYDVLEEIASVPVPDNIISERIITAVGQNGPLREFEYAGVIITLYGAFERLMENLLRVAIKFHQERTLQYANLPEPIRNAYQARICETIGRMGEAREHANVNELKIAIASLNSCLNNHQPYHLALEPMLVHTSNFRKRTINDFFRPIVKVYYTTHSDISAVAEQDIRLRRAVAAHNGMTTNELSAESCFALLDDLVERRNRVAHGQREDNRLNRLEILRYIYYMQVLGQVLHDSVVCPAQSKLLGTHIGTPYRVLQGGAVACVEVSVPIRVGQLIVVCRGETTWFGATITAIQVDKVSREFLEPETPVRAGVEVDVPLMTESCGIYTL